MRWRRRSERAATRQAHCLAALGEMARENWARLAKPPAFFVGICAKYNNRPLV